MFQEKSIFHHYLDLIVVSGDRQGVLCIHTMRSGDYLRTLKTMAGASIDLICITSMGYILAHSWQSKQCCLFWINGQVLLNTIIIPER